MISMASGRRGLIRACDPVVKVRLGLGSSAVQVAAGEPYGARRNRGEPGETEGGNLRDVFP